MNLRPALQEFAQKMERELQKHDATRGQMGWRDESPTWLLDRLHEELVELDMAMDSGTDEEVEKETIDVANFAMMLADVIGLEHPQTPPEYVHDRVTEPAKS